MTEAVSDAPHDGGLDCGATTRAGGRCSQRAGWGTSHVGDGRCKLHGGKAPNAERAAMARRARGEAERLAIDLERHQNPPDVLLAELRRSCALADLFEDQLARGDARLGMNTELGPKMTIETELWQRERDRAIQLSVACLKLGLEDRRVKLVEDAGRQLANFTRAIAAGLGVQDHPDLFVVVERELGNLSLLQAEA